MSRPFRAHLARSDRIPGRCPGRICGCPFGATDRHAGIDATVSPFRSLRSHGENEKISRSNGYAEPLAGPGEVAVPSLGRTLEVVSDRIVWRSLLDPGRGSTPHGGLISSHPLDPRAVREAKVYDCRVGHHAF